MLTVKCSLKQLILISICVLFAILGWTYFYFSRPLVSVVMCVYNGTKNGYLHRSIPSILNQSYPHFELIIVEDGSTDDSYRILQAYASLDKRIRLVKNDKNRGISYSRNRGNALARGKYIMVMDQDDVSLKDRILLQAAFMEAHPEVDISATPPASQHPWKVVYDNDMIKFLLFFNNNLGHPNLMMKRSFLEKHHIHYQEKYKCANDYDLLLQMRDNKAYFATMKEPLFIYNGPGFSGIPNTPCFEESLEIMSRWLDPRNFVSKQKYASAMQEYECALLEKILASREYHHLFSPFFLETRYILWCSNGNRK